MSNTISHHPYTKLRLWASQYGVPGVPDQQAIRDFAAVETTELVTSLRNELSAMVHGNYQDEIVITFLGPERRNRHGSFTDWARIMLQWLASAQKG